VNQGSTEILVTCGTNITWLQKEREREREREKDRNKEKVGIMRLRLTTTTRADRQCSHLYSKGTRFESQPHYWLRD